MNPIEFCPKCGTVLRPRRVGNKIYLTCVNCGYTRYVMTVKAEKPTPARRPLPKIDLDFLEKIIRKERRNAREEAFREVYKAVVIDTSHRIATIKTSNVVRFQTGDPIGLMVGRERTPQYLGTVIDSYPANSHTVLTVLTAAKSSNLIREEDKIIIFDYEPLISYDLQLDLIGQVKGGIEEEEAVIKISNLEAINLILGNAEQPELRRYKVRDIRDVKEKFELDKSQIEAVEAALALEDGELLLIVGPPGTGKTRVIAKIAYELAERGEKVLITSHTNGAVDNAVEILPLERTLRVGRPEKILEHIKPYLLSYRARERLGRKILELDKKVEEYSKIIRVFEEEIRRIKDVYGKMKLKQRLSIIKQGLRDAIKLRNEMIRSECNKLIHEVPIIGSTLIKSQLPPLVDIPFGTVIIDEASQASITLALLAMVKGRKWVIVGDHKQLLPIFRSVKHLEWRKALSAFSALKDKYDHRHLWLQVHYRSNREIIGFLAKYVYENKIRPAKICSTRVLKLKRKPKLEFLTP